MSETRGRKFRRSGDDARSGDAVEVFLNEVDERVSGVRTSRDTNVSKTAAERFDLQRDDLFAGFSGVRMACDRFELGRGLVLSETFAHLMAPFMMAFEPAEPGEAHPAPWKAVQGGLGFDVQVELRIPAIFSPAEWFDRLNTIWWIAALIRMHGTPMLRVPVLASHPYSSIKRMPDDPVVLPIEMDMGHLVPVPKPERIISAETLQWIRKYWWNGGVMMRQNSSFNTAFQALDGCIWVRSSALATITMWGGLQQLFVREKYKVGRRLAQRVSAYLEPAGTTRETLYDRIRQLWDARSDAAHGKTSNDRQVLFDTYSVGRRVLTKIVESNHVPTHAELRKFDASRERSI